MKDQRYNHVEIYECNQNGIQRISAIFYIHGLHGTGFFMKARSEIADERALIENLRIRANRLMGEAHLRTLCVARMTDS